jgi:hypothetical protein
MSCRACGAPSRQAQSRPAMPRLRCHAWPIHASLARSRLAMPAASSRVPSRRALSCPVEPCLACDALSCQTPSGYVTSSHAAPGRVVSSRAWPAVSGLAYPCKSCRAQSRLRSRAMPRLVMSSLAVPSRACDAVPIRVGPCRVEPCPALPAMPCLARPCPVWSRRAMPCLRCLVRSRLVVPSPVLPSPV